MAILGIPLGWILHWMQELIGNYGWTLIIFTILVKLLMTPLTIKQQKSTAKMSAFQPKLKELENKYKNNKEKYQQEMMKLYEKEGISPMGGCLPMVITMIILFGIIEVVYRPLRYVLQISADTIDAACKALSLTSSQQLQIINVVQQGTGEKFELIKNIFSATDIEKIKDFDMMFLGWDLSQIPTLGFNWSIMIPILACASAALMGIMAMRQQKDQGAANASGGKMMKIMNFVSPLISLIFAFQLPAGVGIYWIISNLTSFAQTAIIRKIYTPEKLAKMVENDKGSKRRSEKMRKKREMLEKMSQGRDYYMQQTGKDKDKLDKARKLVENGEDHESPDIESQGKPSSSHTSQIRKKPKTESQPEISANDRIAAARKRLAEMYGEDVKDENNK